MRQRRSALRTPALVERMELPDDAAGRVEVFTVEEAAEEPGDSEDLAAAVDAAGGGRFAAALDSRYAAPAIAVALVVIFLLGMLLKR